MIYSKEVFDILIEKTQLFLIALNNQGEIFLVSNRCQSLFAMPKQDMIGQSIFDFVLDEDEPSFRETIANLSIDKPLDIKSFRFATSNEKGILSLKFDFVLYNNMIYATGVDVTEENKEHSSLLTLSKITKTGAWHFNPINEEIYWSEECYKLHDLPLGTPITREKAINYYPIGTRKKVKQALDNLIQTKKPYDFTERLITEKGIEKWVRVIAKPVIHNDRVIFVNGTIADVTESHSFIKRLRENEETKNLALKGIRSGLFDHLIEDNIVFYSRDFRKMLGLPLEEDFVPEETFRKMIHPDDVDAALQRHHDNLKEKGHHYHNHYRLKHLEGGYRHYEVYGYRKKDSHGNTVRMIGNLIDINQRVINERTIAQSKRRLKAMVNSGIAFFILVDREGKILTADDQTLKIIKKEYNVDPLQTPTLFIDAMPLNFKSNFMHELNEVIAHKKVIIKEMERIRSEGSAHWLESKYTPILNEQNEVNSVLISMHDITERKLAEIKAKEAHIKEQELSALKSNILSNFSHEIRTPLNGIMTISNLIINEQNPEERKKLLNYLEESKDRLLNTINNLSSFSEIETIRNNLDYKELDINFIVESSYRKYRHLARAKNLKYDLQLDESSPIVNLDESMFAMALNNLIHNAIKYTDEKGSVKIKIYEEPSEKNIYISVKDSGIGIKKENIKKMFAPFIQGSLGLNRKYEGTGIGLSLSKRYIEILGGEIKVKSEVGKGSEFIIKIPKAYESTLR